jgi:hypothetical protein
VDRLISSHRGYFWSAIAIANASSTSMQSHLRVLSICVTKQQLDCRKLSAKGCSPVAWAGADRMMERNYGICDVAFLAASVHLRSDFGRKGFETRGIADTVGLSAAIERSEMVSAATAIFATHCRTAPPEAGRGPNREWLIGPTVYGCPSRC